VFWSFDSDRKEEECQEETHKEERKKERKKGRDIIGIDWQGIPVFFDTFIMYANYFDGNGLCCAVPVFAGRC
jgi:hypothetical protein